MRCRHCNGVVEHVVLDLGFAPPSNAYLTSADLALPEKHYPLRIRVCDRCWLVQTEDVASVDELFGPDYAYFTSTSTGALAHAARYAETMIPKLGLGVDSMVVEIASNDGYLLKNFVAADIPCLGIEPTSSTAEAAEGKGIPVVREFFGERLGARLAAEGREADLIVGNNVYAHVPDINDFTRGLKAALKEGGTITLEFPHVKRLIEGAQFDTVYHEHFSYLSVFTVCRIFGSAGLRIWDVEQLPTHGGSLRVFGCHADDRRLETPAVAAVLAEENDFGLQTLTPYRGFQAKVERIKDDLLLFLIEKKRAGKTLAAYGAAAKGSTLLNYAGVKIDLLPFVCDAAAAKQGKFMPGSHLPILPPRVVFEAPPDYLVILPWNIASEVRQQCAKLADHGTEFVTAVPKLEVG
jgi:hypothetical protein